jgi:SecD/SecF fusion protein
MVVLGIFSITYTFMPFDMEINQAFIAAILTVIGYSLNDTVVVFDRIREYRNINKSWEASKIVNTALNSTLSRTLNTSFTTLVVLVSIFLFGGESIRGFMFALIIGVLVGTYSSVFVATPIMFDTLKKKFIS